MNNAECKCLRENHSVRTVAEVMRVIRRTSDPTVRHLQRRNCACTYCKNDRERMGCTNPNKCTKAAMRIIQTIKPKWDVSREAPNDNLTLTTSRKEKNIEERQNPHGKLTFNPTVTTMMPLAEGFRIFTKPEAFSSEPAHRRVRGAEIPEEAITVYTDGSCMNNGDENAAAGSGVWFGHEDPRNIARRVPGTTQTNQAGEVFAITLAARATPPFAPLHIISDSRYAIDGLTMHLQDWSDKGWIGVANADHFKSAAYQLRTRSATTTFEWTKGHAGTEGNEGADRLAGMGAAMPNNEIDHLEVPDRWNLTGAKLATLTQASAYKGIREIQKKNERTAAAAPLDMTRYRVQDDLGGGVPTDATIWQAIRHKDISRNISDFLWRTLHQSQRVGRYWRHIPNYEQRSMCELCDEEESMDHILTECNSPERRLIWGMAESAWRKKHHTWPEPHLGNIIGAPLAQF